MRVKGRKRHILVNTLGLLVANRVESADTSDRRAGALPLGGLSALFSRIRTVIADAGQSSGSRNGVVSAKPQARSNPEAKPRMAATNRQETTKSVQNHGSD